MEKSKRAVIFANGEPNPGERLLEEIAQANLLIAADGGFTHFQNLGIMPHVLLGDFDSIGPEQLEELEEKDILIIRHPSRKDDTDLELALKYLKQQTIKTVTIYYALGSRWDMTVANLLLPSADQFKDMDIRFIDGYQEITLLRGGNTHFISGQVGDTVSLLPLKRSAVGITSQGLEYPLKKDTLRLGSSRGVSNVLMREQASIYVESGLLLCIHIKQSD